MENYSSILIVKHVNPVVDHFLLKKKKIINLENISKENISRRNDDEDVNGLLLSERLG